MFIFFITFPISFRIVEFAFIDVPRTRAPSHKSSTCASMHSSFKSSMHRYCLLFVRLYLCNFWILFCTFPAKKGFQVVFQVQKIFILFSIYFINFPDNTKLLTTWNFTRSSQCLSWFFPCYVLFLTLFYNFVQAIPLFKRQEIRDCWQRFDFVLSNIQGQCEDLLNLFIRKLQQNIIYYAKHYRGNDVIEPTDDTYCKLFCGEYQSRLF